jgi:hypothetical protein
MKVTFPPCPECKRSKWATVDSRADFRQRALRCMECGFEVDARVAVASRRILRTDQGQDVQVDAVSGS